MLMYGISENDDGKDESYNECRDKVLGLLQENAPLVDKAWCSRDIVRAHRIRKSVSRPPEEPRPVTVKFLH